MRSPACRSSAVLAGAEHIPVLLEEVLKHLVISTSGTYVDATFGRGGHARALLAVLGSDARLIVIDQDPEAIAAAHELAAEDDRVTVCHARFSQLTEVLEGLGVDEVDGVLLDVGVSSPQLDDPQRGFSFRNSGPLDMRMDPTSGISAAQWLNEAEVADIARILREYGEERQAGRIARAIERARPLHTTDALAEVVAAATVQRGAHTKHPATRTFQAIRIFVNDELGELEEALRAAFAALCPGGRLAVISFHSLEDRLVKRWFREQAQPPAVPRRVPIRHAEQHVPGELIGKAIRPGTAELARNPRARSATLRVLGRRKQEAAGG